MSVFFEVDEKAETNKDIEKQRTINLKKQAALTKLLQTSMEETDELKTLIF